MKKFWFPLFLFFSIISTTQGQVSKLHSTFNNELMDDSLRATAMNSLIMQHYLYRALDSAFFYNEVLLKFADAKKLLFWKGRCFQNFGQLYQIKGDNYKSLDNYGKEFEIGKKIGNKFLIATAQLRIGVILSNQGNIKEALRLMKNSLKVFKEIGDIKGVLDNLLAISRVNYDNNDNAGARRYSLEVIKTVREKELAYNISDALMMLAIQYKDENPDTSLILILESEKIRKQENDTLGLINVTRAKAEVYLVEKKFAKAKIALQEVIDAKESLNITDGLPDLYSKLAEIQWGENEKEKAYANILKAKKLLSKANDIDELIEVYRLLVLFYKEKGDYKKSNKYLEKYYIYRDSLVNETNNKLVLSQQFRYNYDKKIFADSVRNNARLLVKETELTNERVLRENAQAKSVYLSWIIGLIIVSVLFILNRFRITNRQKKTIEKQKLIVDTAYNKIAEKNSEIHDSMNYAKRIQSAILPNQNLFTEKLPHSFILYLPKDIISGDFYWIKETEDVHSITFAVADCTGHGIPGAMVSVLCNNLLNKSVKTLQLSDPAKILDECREMLIHELENSETKVKDGMDIALCKIEGKALYFAGANSLLWCVRNKEIIELKGDKQPVANFENARPFQTKQLRLEKNDMIYLFSDGFADQFGGKKNKKFKYGPLREKLKEISVLPEDQQKNILESVFNRWRGENEQVDDICILGVRV